MSSTAIVDIASDNDSDSCIEKPIIQFLKRLINGKSQTKTLLTNAQIMEILKSELGLDIAGIHNLEEITYLHVMKNCLLNWPDWTEFSKHVFKFEELSDAEKKAVLKSSYESLKSYLFDIYKAAVPLTKSAVKEVLAEEGPKSSIDPTPNPNVVLNICATKSQLQKLIFRQPNPNLGGTIFNVHSAAPRKRNIISLSMQSILNWCGVKLYIRSPGAQPNVYIYKREVKHKYKHCLVNKKLHVQPTPPEVLNQVLLTNDGKGKTVKSVKFVEAFKKIGKLYSTIINDVDEIFDFVVIEMLMLPTDIFPKTSYRRYTNKYPYIRYLYEDVENVSSHVTGLYDLQLEETMKPLYEFYLGNTYIDSRSEVVARISEGAVVIECTSCHVLFSGKSIVSDVKGHFELNHSNENNFKCTNCAKEFAVDALTNNWWCHDC